MGTTSKHRRWRVGRLQFGFHLYVHHSPHLSDRWVVQPFVIYDRKPA